MKEAYLYEKLEDRKVRCRLCNHQCVIANGKKGLCHVRENSEGTLHSLVYEKVIAAHCDPIEKKPLFHFLPGTLSYSIATVGCNFKCLFCQNADISQMPFDSHMITGRRMSPDQIVTDAVNNNARSISYTYTEPTIYFELAADTAELSTAKGLKNVFVTNGYMSRQCLEQIHPDLHAANVDLKAFSEDFYKNQCSAKLAPVLESIKTMKEMGVWVEVTTLLIPGLNDAPDELKKLAGFLADTDTSIPWHISRFHPTYRLSDHPVTPSKAVQKARQIGLQAGLRYVYAGNLPGDDGEKTFCHECGELLIDRYGFSVRQNRITNGCCPACNADIPGVWEKGPQAPVSRK